MTTNDIDAIRNAWVPAAEFDALRAERNAACREVARLTVELEKANDLKDRYARTAADLLRQRNDHAAEIEQLRAELAEYAADNQRVAAALVKTDAQLTAAQQNIRDRYEQITKLELLVADLERQCNEQMHELAERARTQETTR